MPREILNLEEAAELLEVTPQILRREATRGHVPGRRIGRQWRFSRLGLHAWLAHTTKEEPVEEQQEKDPWAPFYGIFANDPDFEEVVRNIEAERERQRREAQEQADAQEIAA